MMLYSNQDELAQSCDAFDKLMKEARIRADQLQSQSPAGRSSSQITQEDPPPFATLRVSPPPLVVNKIRSGAPSWSKLEKSLPSPVIVDSEKPLPSPPGAWLDVEDEQQLLSERMAVSIDAVARSTVLQHELVPKDSACELLEGDLKRYLPAFDQRGQVSAQAAKVLDMNETMQILLMSGSVSGVSMKPILGTHWCGWESGYFE